MIFRTFMAVLFIAVAAPALSDTANQETPPRLVFAQKEADECKVAYWHWAIREPVTLARTDECPDSLFIDQSKETVLFVDGGHIHWTEIAPGSEVSRTPLPERNYKAWLDQMEVRPDRQKGNNKPLNETMEPEGARFLDDGALSILMSVGMLADDKYQYVYRRSDEGWSVVASRHCRRFGCDDTEKTDREGFRHYVSTSASDEQTWPRSRMVWHPALTENQYVTYQKDIRGEDSSASSMPESVEVGVKVNDTSSALTADITESAHFVGMLYTMHLDLRVGSDKPRNLSESQCTTSVVGHYILVSKYESYRKFELTDLSTGETVLNDLRTAAWID